MIAAGIQMRLNTHHQDQSIFSRSLRVTKMQVNSPAKPTPPLELLLVDILFYLLCQFLGDLRADCSQLKLEFSEEVEHFLAIVTIVLDLVLEFHPGRLDSNDIHCSPYFFELGLCACTSLAIVLSSVNTNP